MMRLRACVYALVGVVCVGFNMIVFNIMLLTSLETALCNTVAFIAGGQLSFILHDRKTFRDRHPTREGWKRRWMKFMSGNLAALGVNATAATVLIIAGIFPQLVNLGAMAVSGLFSFTWTNLYSHRSPAPPGVES